MVATLAQRVFKVEQGDVVGIIGRNGAGKSTLLKLLSCVTVTSAKDFLSSVSPAQLH